jgi:hypothetical protein
MTSFPVGGNQLGRVDLPEIVYLHARNVAGKPARKARRADGFVNAVGGAGRRRALVRRVALLVAG